MSEGVTSVFDRLHLSSLQDGDWRRDQQGMGGLARLTPYLYFGSDHLDDVTVDGYYNCSSLAHFRVAVKQIRPKDLLPVVGEHGVIDPRLSSNHACPNMFDLDTRNLYLGQLNSNPAQQPANTLIGTAVRGLPVRLQQVHFRAFNPQGESDEYAAYFLCSNPVGPFGAYNSRKRLGSGTYPIIDSDFTLHGGAAAAAPKYWTYNQYTASTEDPRRDFEGRLIIGTPLRVSAYPGGMLGETQPMCPNPMNNCMEIIFDTDGFHVSQLTSTTTQRGFKYAIPMGIIVQNRYKFIQDNINANSSNQSESGMFTCKSKIGWRMIDSTNWEEERSVWDHIRLVLMNECNEFEQKRVLLRPPPLDTVATTGPGKSRLGAPGHPSASAVGSLDGNNWEAVPLLQLEDFCNTPQVLPHDLMTIPVLENCTHASVGGVAEDLTPCETTLGMVCLEDIAKYVIDYLFKVINKVPQEDEMEEDDKPTRGIVTRVHATTCAIRSDYITAEGTKPPQGGGIGGAVDALDVSVCLNEEVIALVNCGSSCAEESTITPDDCEDVTYERCLIAEPILNPYLINGPCTPCAVVDIRPGCFDGAGDPLPEGTLPEECRLKCNAVAAADEAAKACAQEFIEDPPLTDGGTTDAGMFAAHNPSAQACTEGRTANCPPG